MSRKGKKPKAGHAIMIKNAKRNKVSKDPNVRYPDADTMIKAFGIRVNPNKKGENK